MNYEHIDKIIKDYLATDDIDAAIFINGKWGVGKTYYWLDRIEKLVRETKNPSNINYVPIYISLNGISSTTDIINQIASSLLILKLPSWYKKLSGSRFSTITFGLLNSISMFIKNKEIRELNKINYVELMDFSNKVICFDDLERISEKISIEEIIGFISRNFLENQFAKVIIIGSEDGLDESNKNKFVLKKEKIIYREIKFEPEYSIIYLSLCNQILKRGRLKSVLKKESDFFIKLLKNYNIENLRTVRNIIITLKYMYDHYDSDFFLKLRKSIILFTIIVTKEFKEGKINKTLSEAYKDYNYELDNRVKFSIMEQGNESAYQDDAVFQFYKNYIKQNENIYCFFRSIYSYVVNGYTDKTVIKLDQLDLAEDKKDQLLRSIEDFHNLSDQGELQQICDELLKYINQGDILFYNFPYIFSKYEIFVKHKLYSKRLEQLFNVFKNGLDKSYSSFNQIVADQNISVINDNDSQYLKKLKEKVNYFHEELKRKKEKENAEKLYYEFDRGNGDFDKHLTFFFKKRLFEFINPSSIYNRLFNAKPMIISSFTTFLYNKYSNDNYLIFEDIEGLEEINKVLRERIKNESDSLKKYSLDGVIEQIDLIVPELKKKKGTITN